MSETEVAGGTEAPKPAPEAPVSPDAAPDAVSAPPVAATAAVPPAPTSPDVGGDGDGSSSSDGTARKRRRRGSRGGRKRSKPRADADSTAAHSGDSDQRASRAQGRQNAAADDRIADDRKADDRNPDLPDLHREGRPASPEAAAKALVPKMPPPGARPKPKIGDTIPAEALRAAESGKVDDDAGGGDGGKRRRRRRGGRGRSSGGGARSSGNGAIRSNASTTSGSSATATKPIEAVIAHDPTELDEETLGRRRGRERKGRPVGRYMMCVHVTAGATQIAVLEGR
ncbi:MAG: hypothetical protein ACRDZN_15300, partial [Acidimicrobiales bacterium]